MSNALPNPKLELHNSRGELLATNDNWRDTQAAQLVARGLAPEKALESALFATLPAGSYTAVVRGVGNKTGVAVVEIYSLGE